MKQMKNGKKLAIKSGVRAGRGTITVNHNEKLVRGKKLAIKSGVRAGGLNSNHNEKLVRGKKLAIKSGVRAGVKQWGLVVGTG